MTEDINEVVKLYFKGYSVEQALELVRDKVRDPELYLIIKSYESRLRDVRSN